MRFVAILGLIVSVISSAAWADTTLQCTETLYDKTGNNPYDIPHYFILQDGDIFRKAILVWDNEKVDLTVVTNTPATIEATGKAKAHMPRPVEIDQCVKDAVDAFLAGVSSIASLLGSPNRAAVCFFHHLA